MYGYKLKRPSAEVVKEHIELQRELKSDQYIDAENVCIEQVPFAIDEKEPIRHYNGKDVDETFEFTRSAFGQLVNRVKVPLQFYDRCPKHLQVAIFDHFITGKKDTKFLFRNLDIGHEDRTDVRAVLSDKYGIIDDHQVFPVVLDALEGENIDIMHFMYDDKISQLLIHFLETSTHYQGTDMDAGLLVSNSETGHGAVWLEPVVTIPSCSFVNRRALRAQKVDMRIVHKGDVDAERIKKMAQQAKEIAQVGIVQVAEAWEAKVKAAHALSYAKGIDGLPKRMYDILEEEWSKEEDLIRAEVARRIMLLAKELPLFKSIPVQQSAGQFLGLYNNYKARMQQIMEEME